MVKNIAHKICWPRQVHNVKPVQKKLFACQSWCLKQFIDVKARIGNGLQQSEMVQRIKCLAAFKVSNFKWFAQAQMAASCLSRHAGNWKTSFLIAQSPLTSSKKAVKGNALPLNVLRFLSPGCQKLPSCLAEGQVQLAK